MLNTHQVDEIFSGCLKRKMKHNFYVKRIFLLEFESGTFKKNKDILVATGRLQNCDTLWSTVRTIYGVGA